MPYMLVRHKVDDYAKWKPVFDDHGDFRKANGEKSYQIFRPKGDPNDEPNNLIILFEWDSLDNAKKFAQSESLWEAMKKAGVIGQPHIHFLEEIEKGAV